MSPEHIPEACVDCNAGHRIDREHDCFLMNCKDLGPELERLLESYRELADRLEAALAPDGTHRIIEGGYCLDCQGGCMRDFVNQPVPVAYVEPTPFGGVG